MDKRITAKQNEAIAFSNPAASNNRPGWVSDSIVVMNRFTEKLVSLSGFDSFNHRRFLRLCEMESIVPPKKRVKRVKTSSHTLKCLPQNRNKRTSRTSEDYCPICKFHIRGVNHNSGSHHMLAAGRKTA